MKKNLFGLAALLLAALVFVGCPTDDDTGGYGGAVDIDSIINGPITGSHTHVIRYHIEGSPHRAKAPYHLAVFPVYIQGPDDPQPILNSEHGWGKDFLSMKEPFELRHEPDDVGKTAHYRAHWETEGGVKGPWSMASAEVP
jgi:hypothetical protein